MVDLEDDLKCGVRSREDIGRCVFAEERLGAASLKTHPPNYFCKRVFRIQRGCFQRVDGGGRQASRPEKFFAPGKNFQEVFLLHALDACRSTEHKGVGITSRDLLYVKFCVGCLVAREEKFYFGVFIAHRSHDSTRVSCARATCRASLQPVVPRRQVPAYSYLG